MLSVHHLLSKFRQAFDLLSYFLYSCRFSFLQKLPVSRPPPDKGQKKKYIILFIIVSSANKNKR
uniref:Uncharacterized protein n=1 Tax=Octopus bimaculoides TaxID=37653 RepID=A0A0L8H8W1_OCTBM